MMILLFFAFLAGIVTILSPCILPILPAILSVGTMKGRLRPLGVILGLVFSFTFFTLALTLLVHATGISPDILRYIAIALIFFFGLVMIFPSLSNWFAKKVTPIASAGQSIQSTIAGNGFGGGFIFGIALGLLWTPCAGPILAAITALVATQSVTLATVLITLAYSLGAAIPLFLIAYGGSQIIQSSKFLSIHSEGIRQCFGVLMILTSIAIALHWDMALQQNLARFFPPILIEDNALVKQELQRLGEDKNRLSKQIVSFVESDKLSDYGNSPELTGIVNWINSPPLSIQQLKGKVVLIDFWTYSCINCLRTLPFIEKWNANYKKDGLVVIGVHTPEFEFEKNPQNVAEAAMRLGVEYPIAQDNDYKTWNAFHNRYWPAHYLIDREGRLRMVHYGEGGYVETENGIRELLGLSPLQMKEPEHVTRPITHETYLGLDRASSYASGINLVGQETVRYDYKGPLGSDEVGLKGSWKAENERIVSESDESFIDLNFQARKVYLVLSGSSKVPLEVNLDGQPSQRIIVDGDRKYDMISTAYGRHLLSLKVPKGVSAYAFTFGDE